MSINEERYQEILENTREVKAQVEILKEVIEESDSLKNAQGSANKNDNLSELLEDTKLASEKASESIRSNLPLILSSIQSGNDQHGTLSSTVDTLLEQYHEISKRTQSQGTHLDRLLSLSEAQESALLRGNGVVTNDDLDRVVAQKNNTILEHLTGIAGSVDNQQKQTLTLLNNVKEQEDAFSSNYQKIFSAIGKESEAIINELNKAIKQSEEVNTQNLSAIPDKISELGDTLTTKLDKAILSSKPTNENDHLIPELAAKLNDLSTAVEKSKEEYINAHYNTTGGLYDRLEELIMKEEAEQHASSSAVTETQAKLVQNKIKTHSEVIETKLNTGFSELEEKLCSLEQEFNTVSEQQEAREKEQASFIRELVDGALKCTAGTVTSHQEELLSEIVGLDDKLDAISNATARAIEDNSNSLADIISKGLESLGQSGNTALEKYFSAEISDLSGQFSKLSDNVRDLYTQTNEETRRYLESRMMELVGKEVAAVAKKMEEMEAKRVQEKEHLEQAHAARIAELEQELKNSTQRAAEAETRAQAAEDKAAQELQLHKLELQSLKFMNWDLERHEKKITELEQETRNMANEKAKLQTQLASLNSAYDSRLDELESLENRVEGFERRLGQALLNRSKAILGSTTMTIINSNNHHAHAGSHQGHYSRNRDSQVSSHFGNSISRSNSTSSNGSNALDAHDDANTSKGNAVPGARRHLSLAADQAEKGGVYADSDSDDGFSGGKENDFGGPTTLMKKQRGSNLGISRGPYGLTPGKHRSVSLFTPGDLSD